MKTAFHYDPAYLDHNPGQGHPERRERLVAAMGLLEKQSWFGGLQRVSAQPADRRWIEAVHASAYISEAAEACRNRAPFLHSPDVGICAESYDIALLAAGGAIALADEVISGAASNGFGLIRPPGHHAEQSQALGFCLFNNAAVLARYLQKQHGLDKILILDWDVHHGNGTQHTFEEDPSVLYVSLHQYPYYPGTGAVSESGAGRGKGATLNCPMPAGANDDDYQAAFSEYVLPKIDTFKPEAIIISAGFDAHRDDPLAQVELSTDCYRWMSERLMEKADQHAGGRLISILEGGYDLNALSLCVVEHLKVLSGARD